jgi:hypothetical protein
MDSDTTIYKFHITIFLPTVHRSETWSFTLRLRIFKHRVLRKIFGPNWEEVTEGWK